MYRLNVYAPESHLEQVKAALFEAGAGKIGRYDCCSWQTKGEGQFRPKKGSDPFIGQVELLEKVVEYKLEMVVASEALASVVTALRTSHPYEEPAFDLYAMLSLGD